MSLRYDEIAEILKIIDGSSCEELIVETGDVKIIVRRNCATGASVPTLDIAAPTVSAGPVARYANAPSAKAAPHQCEVAAPMVGTFYRAPAPDAPPFVDIGSVVHKGQPLCLIEVMKLFTTINSEFDGRIVQIGADNGELVEYGQTLFVIEPAA